MNKSEFVDRLREKGWKKYESIKIIDDFLDAIEECLTDGETINFQNFGVFYLRKRKALLGRNPRKPEDIYIVPETIVPTWKPAKTFRRVFNDK